MGIVDVFLRILLHLVLAAHFCDVSKSVSVAFIFGWMVFGVVLVPNHSRFPGKTYLQVVLCRVIAHLLFIFPILSDIRTLVHTERKMVIKNTTEVF